MGRAGLEHPPLKQSKTAISTGGGAESGAPDAPNTPQTTQDTSELPPDLAKIAAAWPDLPEHIKAAIKALVQTHNAENK